MAEPAVRKHRTIAGWPVARVIAAVLLTAALVWAAWTTRTVVELQQRRIVSVSLSRLVEDFVAAEARNGGTPEQSASRTASYLAAVNKAVAEFGQGGTTVLVSEATLGRSVDDRTADVRARVARAMEAEHDRR
ncbi:Type-F conjugative transfer system protein (TrbI_Ftype) [Sphingomonas sp. EC-HK361]|uniref:TrbI F-type domain-containing protein n=1 Tax=Sphingomonas sp. EC-HK361 TaxID=2038397 RepID=UPI0012574D99|nr:TrbI F-type domain-containing protein [Sphingomonas sp. EC-HK361]VVT10103.1 Type-F conjugative transfer system protein (TrbI_Ftype) [Sphingomonas sp. EC-HK361]